MLSNDEENVVEEFPRPPRYYEYFDVDYHQLKALRIDKPPEIPNDLEENGPYSRIYEGVFDRNRFPSAGPTSGTSSTETMIPSIRKKEIKG